jgi:hypothetical protein
MFDIEEVCIPVESFVFCIVFIVLSEDFILCWDLVDVIKLCIT